MRWLRLTYGVVRYAGLAVTLSVATNQILSDKGLSWTWLYLSLGVAVLTYVVPQPGAAEPGGTAPARPATVPGGRRRTYLRQLRENVKDMETIGLATQGEFVLRLSQVYVDVSVTRQVLHATTGEPYLGAASGETGGLGERRSLESVLRDAGNGQTSRVLAVIGGPGSGKTTLARKTALTMCEHRWRTGKRRLPVLLYLRDHAAALLAENPPGLAELAVSAGWLDGKVSARWLDRQLDKGRCVVLLDGLDEVADQADRVRVVNWVRRQTQRHPHNIYVVTSRPHGYQSNPLPDAEVLQVRRFTGEQIHRFLRQWSHAIESRARSGSGREVVQAAERNAFDLQARLRDRPELYDLAANPLLLTMIANVHRYRGQLPGSRAELYAEMCDVLLHRRYEAKGLRDGTGLSGPHKQYVVQRLALAMMKDKVRDWPSRKAVGAIRRPLRQVPGDVDPEVFLDEARKSGLLVERDQGVYGFAHLTLQEYLAAAQLGTARADTSVLVAGVDDVWWRETIQLWAAGNDATEIISACLDSGTVHALALAFDCADIANTVEPAVRERLEALLTRSFLGSPELQRLLAGVLATRTLRETIQHDERTALCVRPVPRALYDMFVREEARDGHPHHPRTPEGPSGAVAVGMQAGDAERFAAWVSSITPETTYRLPQLEEISDHANAIQPHLRDHTVWVQQGGRTALFRQEGVAWPYTAGGPRSTSNGNPEVRGDLLETGPYLSLLAVPAVPQADVPSRARVMEWAGGVFAAVTQVPIRSSDGEYLFQCRELILDLSLCLALRKALEDATREDRSATGDRTRRQSLEHARTLADLLNHDHFHDRSGPDVPLHHIDEALSLDPGLDRSRGRGTSLAYALVAAVRHFVGHLREFMDSAQEPLDQLANAAVGARVYADNIQAALDLGIGVTARSLSDLPDFTRAAEPALTFLGPRCGEQDAGSGAGPVGAGVGLEAARQAENMQFPLAGDVGLPVPDYPFLAVELALSERESPGAGQVALSAYVSALAHEPPIAPVGQLTLARLEQFLSRVRPVAGRAPEDPVHVVRGVRADLDRLSGVSPVVDRLLSLLDEVAALLDSVRDRGAPSDPRTLAACRTALRVVIGSLHPDEFRVSTGDLDLVRQTLTAVGHPRYHATLANQSLLLTRVQG